MGYSSKGCKESDMTEQLCMHYILAFYLLYISIPISIYIYIYIYITSFFILQAKYSNCLYSPFQILALQPHWAETFPSIYLIPWI